MGKKACLILGCGNTILFSLIGNKKVRMTKIAITQHLYLFNESFEGKDWESLL